jgi:hypothetical protein
LILALLVKRPHRFDFDRLARHRQGRAGRFKRLQYRRWYLIGNGRYCVRFSA